ncbi:MAG: hypothetical protein HOC74_00160 [Gemmatimonadetes bacterium]|jgi:hypothetical protein|nr:hypothetical protein [Gemmatimonadota bacterium]
MSTATVQQHNGAPTLFIDGQPTFGAVHWIPEPPQEGDWFAEPFIHQFADAGVHLIHCQTGCRGAICEWDAPDENGNTYYFERLLPRLRRVLAIDPDAYFILRVHLEMYAPWWQKLYPQELELWGDGRTENQSYASAIWRQQAGEFLEALVHFLQSVPEGERVIGYQPAAGQTGEWVKESAMEGHASDYSAPMRAYFRSWLNRKYETLNDLRLAWRDGRAMFNTAEVPTQEEQEEADLYHFRDPSRGCKVIDYFECVADLVADCIDQFCGHVKKASNGQALAGVFYGYVTELTWSNGFFHQRQDMIHPSAQRSGHLGLAKVLASPHVDFMASPYSYGFRGIGGDGLFMALTESVRLHGKLWFNEEDTRTYKFPPDSGYGVAKDARESVSVLTRNFSIGLEHSTAAWWADWAAPGRGPYDDPDILAAMAKFVEVGGKSLSCPDRSPGADLAVIVDERSFAYERLIRTLDWPLIYRQRHWGLARIGAPHDLYLLDDLERLPRPYRCYLFLNAFHLSAAQRETVSRKICRDGAVVAWMYMNGAIADNLHPDNMSALTGMRFRWDMTAWSLNMLLTGFDHPITCDLPANTAWGTDEQIGPIPYIDDPDAHTLGTLVSVRGSSLPGMCVKEMDGWTSLYIGAPNVPSNVLRAILQFAGGHIFSHSDDVLHAGRDFVSLHTVKGEEKTIHLPRKTDVVDVMADRTVANGVDQFTDRLEAGDTKIYYYGETPWEQLTT